MRVGTARAAAAEWVRRHAGVEDGFRGAFFSGSTVGLADDVELPSASDVDVIVVTDRADPPAKLGKFSYLGALLEVSHLGAAEFASADEVLGCYYLASSFRVDTIIADPTGHLRDVHEYVSRRFDHPDSVLRRCAHIRRRIEDGLRTVDPAAPLPDRVIAWLFPTSLTTQLFAVAALRNPTVRLRYLVAREVLTDLSRADLYPALLALLGCAELDRERVQRYLLDLGRTFDATAEVARTRFAFSADITAPARRVVIDGSQHLIDRGHHREAVFWIVATFARCHKILAVDGSPELRHELTPAFEAVVADLGVASPDDVLHRVAEVTRSLPALWATTEAIAGAAAGRA